MKSRITNQSPLLKLVVQVSRKDFYVSDAAQHHCCSKGWAWFWDSSMSMILAAHATGAAPHVPRIPKCSSHCFPPPHWLCPSSSQLCLSSNTPLPPAMLAKQPPPAPDSFCHPAPRRQKFQLLPFNWRSALPFWMGKKLSVFWCPSSLMRKIWPPMIQCIMGLESPALERWRGIFYRSV